MSDWVKLAFVSKSWPEPSPAIALNYFSGVLEGLLCDSIPKMPAGNPYSAVASFVAECVRAIGDPRCVELRNLPLVCEQESNDQNWSSSHPIWNHVDLLVDVDGWMILEPAGQRSLPGADAQSRFHPEQFDRWPRRVARIVALFAARKPKPKR